MDSLDGVVRVVCDMVYSLVWIQSAGCVWFFFQAEDGIRDLVRSRGLGDVYKRQVLRGALAGELLGRVGDLLALGIVVGRDVEAGVEAVSYTHLTLPTSDLV